MVAELSPFAQGASAYFDLGWFPIPTSYFGQRLKGELVDSKKPLVKGFTGYQDEPDNWTSSADIAKWSRQIDRANLGLRLPKNVIGIDVDAYEGKAGRSSLAKFEADYGPLAATWTTTSKIDGVSGIRLYRLPDGVDASELVGGFPGVEIIKWNHRFISVAPSLHVKSGDPYFWVLHGERLADGNVPAVDELSFLTILQTNGLRSDSYSAGLKRINRVYDWIDWLGNYSDRDSQACEWLEDLVAFWCRKIEEAGTAGGAHDVMVMGTYALLNDFSIGHRSGIISALEQYRSAFLDAVHHNRSVGQRSLSEAEDEFDRAVRDYCEKLDTAEFIEEEPCELEAAIIDEEAEEREIRKLAKKKVRDLKANRLARAEFNSDSWAPPNENLIFASDLIKIERERHSMRIDRLMGDNHNVVIAGKYGCGKTTLGLNVVKCALMGQEFLGNKVYMKGGRVLWINGEMDEQDFSDKIQAMGITNLDRFLVLNLRGSSLALNNESSVLWLIEILKKNNVEWLFIDSWRRILSWAGVKEIDNSEIDVLTDTLDRIKRDSGCSLLTIVAHMGREKHESGEEHVRGGTALDDWCDVRWLLNKGRGVVRTFAVDKRVPSPFFNCALSFDHESQLVSVATGSDLEEASTDITAEDIGFAEAVSDVVRKNPGQNQSGLIILIKNYSITSNRENALRFIRLAVSRNLILKYEKIGKGTGAPVKYYPKDFDMSSLK